MSLFPALVINPGGRRWPGPVTALAASAFLHLAAVILLLGLSLPPRSQGDAVDEPADRLVHVFVPAVLPTVADESPATPAQAAEGTPAQASAYVENSVNAIELEVAASPALLLAALAHRDGVLGVADAGEPRTIVRQMTTNGLVASTDEASVDMYWAVKINDGTVRARFMVGPDEVLYGLFPREVADEVHDQVDRAISLHVVPCAGATVLARYSFDGNFRSVANVLRVQCGNQGNTEFTPR